MKTSKQTLILLGATILTITFISWDRNKQSTKKSDPAFSRIFSVSNTDLPWGTGEYAAYMADLEYGFSGTAERTPPAEDVLVQKIPGDNYHLLLMAVYSFENYSGKSVTIDNNGEQVVLRDDGQGFDKVAGDGVFTAKIFTDVNEFRKAALAMNEQMKKNGPQVHFYNRMIATPENCITGELDALMLDKNQPVSIANLDMLKDMVHEGQLAALNAICLEKFKNRYDDLDSKKKEKLKKQYPVLFQTEYS